MKKTSTEAKRRLFRALVLMALVVVTDGAFGAAPPESGPLPFVSPIFGDSMVLQRGKPNAIWGWSQPGDTRARGDRREVRERQPLEPTAAGRRRSNRRRRAAPTSVKITGRQTVELHDVLVGDVWICSGQSNMAFGLGQARNGADEIKNANHPQIRYYNVRPAGLLFPRGRPARLLEGRIAGHARRRGPVGGISAVAYFFARKLQESVHVPIGLIQVAVGGVPAETFASPESLAFGEGLRRRSRRGGGARAERGSGARQLHHALVRRIRHRQQERLLGGSGAG